MGQEIRRSLFKLLDAITVDRYYFTIGDFMQKDSHVLFDGLTTITNTTSYSQVVNIADYYGYSIHAIWTGASTTGSVELEASIDGNHWEAETDSLTTIAGPGSVMVNLKTRFYRYFRFKVISTNSYPITMYAVSFSKGAIR